ncbi:hypothetical protein TNCV_4841361 [Trichonephila clavipes]|uniref:Uncharacterized protein n=1 Tax=Trichonephila clavipes TaxID=2585209 RepID=A0A8X6WK53_TRICX|nr:hypothetical protein TNCV_4841361 [Trichonephila clavipes]
MTGSRVASDVLSGENFKEAVKTRSKESGKKLAQKAIDRVQSMVGKGQYKRKRKKQKKFISSKARKFYLKRRQRPPYFQGVYSRDTLPPLEENMCAIVNSDDSSQPGTHWLALFVNDKRELEFYDSLDNLLYSITLVLLPI